MKRKNGNGGFTLAELMIAVSIIAVLSSIAVPKLMNGRISANENAAIATLRSIAVAQEQFSSSVAVDTDADGGGEFGYFGELASTAPLRVYNPVTDDPDLGVAGADPLYLSTPFGDVQADVNGEGVLEHQGYFFKIYLPGPRIGGLVTGVPEDGTPGVGGATAGGEPNADNCEIFWACYAWPVRTNETGNRAFMINQEGDVLQVQLQSSPGPRYDGAVVPGDLPPAFDAAFAIPGDMSSALGLAAHGTPAADGNLWVAVAD